MPGSPSLRALALSALLGCACSGAPRAALSIDPPVAALAPGETTVFSADVAGTDEPVVWEVVEPDGGAVDERGRYTAPGTEGTFHVRAWVGSADTLRTAEVRVRRSVLAQTWP